MEAASKHKQRTAQTKVKNSTFIISHLDSLKIKNTFKSREWNFVNNSVG